MEDNDEHLNEELREINENMARILDMTGEINHKLEGILDKTVDIHDTLRNTIAKVKTRSQALQYKDYIGTIEWSKEDQVYHGKVTGIKDLVTFESVTLQDLEQAFRDAVDAYLDMCKCKGINPQLPN